MSVTEPLSPTTGEPVSVVASRNRLGIWLIIVNTTAGSLALLISYTYLWSLNVNNAWAPPNNGWAPLWPFWAIFAVEVLAGLVMRWAWKGMQKGERGRMLTGSLVSSLLLIVAFLAQVAQIISFPFGPSDGGYASVTFWFAFSNAGWVLLSSFLAFGIFNRTLAGKITASNASHAGLVAMWLVWLAGVALIGAICTSTMQESPNSNPPAFGNFQEQ